MNPLGSYYREAASNYEIIKYITPIQRKRLGVSLSGGHFILLFNNVGMTDIEKFKMEGFR
jgi:hypothetical protein